MVLAMRPMARQLLQTLVSSEQQGDGSLRSAEIFDEIVQRTPLQITNTLPCSSPTTHHHLLGALTCVIAHKRLRNPVENED